MFNQIFTIMKKVLLLTGDYAEDLAATMLATTGLTGMVGMSPPIDTIE